MTTLFPATALTFNTLPGLTTRAACAGAIKATDDASMALRNPTKIVDLENDFMFAPTIRLPSQSRKELGDLEEYLPETLHSLNILVAKLPIVSTGKMFKEDAN